MTFLKPINFQDRLIKSLVQERGTGDVKILKHVENGTCRVLMRRDKTLKICANHFVRPWMELRPNCGSEKAWVWKVQADYADEEPKPETLAIKFGNVENAKKFNEAFEESVRYVVQAEAAKILAEESKEADDGEEKTDKEKEVTEAAEGLKDMAIKPSN